MKEGDPFFSVRGAFINSLGKRVGCGAEGAVHEVAGSPSQCAKIYSLGSAPDRRLRQFAKLRSMVVMSEFTRATRLAWPREVIHNQRGEPVGFTMPRVGGVPLTVLSAPRLIRERLRAWNPLNTLRVVHDLAVIFGSLERADVLVCDFNFNNFILDPVSARVSLIDCDSFQVSRKGATFRAEVVTPEFMAPEALAKPASGIVGPSEMRFGAAILFFQVLCEGWHPFQCLGALSPVENILAGRTAMGASHGLARGFWPNPIFEKYRGFSPILKRRFLEALVWGHSSPDRRPHFAQWVEACLNQREHLRGAR